ncbi:MAG TPA: hypothetical protein VKT77_22765 [Chthonomonadaceae bacterium]|nr:hypothetical protein [Chthonomonadaceae bacterium]
MLDRRLEGADAFSVNWTAIAEFVLCLEERFELEVPEREVSGLRGRISDPEMTVIALAALVERYRVA